MRKRVLEITFGMVLAAAGVVATACGALLASGWVDE